MKQRCFPPRLKTGDLLGLVSPASPPKDDASIPRGISSLLARGYYVRMGWGVGLRDGYLAGPDRVRAQDIMDMFGDARVGAILCTRGGYGSARLLDMLDYEFIRRNPKILVGFSDITALSLALFAHAGLVTFAGPMVAPDFGSSILPAVEDAFWNMLCVRHESFRFSGGQERTIARGTAEGLLLGGNLAVFCSLIGTSHMPDLRNAILFFEEVGEDVYRIDRMFRQLQQAGILNNAAGVVLGSFTGVPDTDSRRDLETVFREYLLPLRIPVLANFPFGHIPDKYTIPLGTRVRLDADQRSLTLLEAAVS